MAYATTNPPRLLSQSIGAVNGNLWVYLSADAATLTRVSGYFTNGFELGIRPGDVLFQVDTDTSALTIQFCNASTAAATDFSDGTAITATDTD